MKITKIKLNNIGPYRGENNIFDINVEKGKNIILVGGKNGAGKTTLLNSIKTGLSQSTSTAVHTVLSASLLFLLLPPPTSIPTT